MELLNIFVIAVALGIDAFSVALGAGAYLEKTTIKQRFRLTFHFGLFQLMMPIIGWAVGEGVVDLIYNWDHWLVFIILGAIGGKMIYEALKNDEEKLDTDITKGYKLIALSIATSIDALAVGFSLALMKQEIVIPSIIIGIVAAAMTFSGIIIGEKASVKFGRKAEILGGMVLIIIGLKILLEHMADH